MRNFINGYLCRVLCLFMVAAVAGCVSAPRQVAMDAGVWQDKVSVIGVALAPAPTPATFKTGAQGLLDIAINNAMAGGLDEYLVGLDLARFTQMQDRVIRQMELRGLRVKKLAPVADAAYPENGDQTGRDYSALRAREGIDKLLLIELSQVGTTRSYYGFIPTGAPQGYAKGSGRLVDLKTGELEWRFDATSAVPVAGDWDKPPKYQALTRAIDDALSNVVSGMDTDLFRLAGSAAPEPQPSPAPAAEPTMPTNAAAAAVDPVPIAAAAVPADAVESFTVVALPLPRELTLTAPAQLKNRPAADGAVIRILETGTAIQPISSMENAGGFWVFTRTIEGEQGWARMQRAKTAAR